jgi:Flp pilus assembly pilin Flp
MPKSEFGRCSRRPQAARRLIARALRPFRGSASGATLVEYLIVVGFCAFIAILGFYRFGRTLHSALRVEARHIEGKDMPEGGGLGGALELLDALGAVPDPFQPQDLVESIIGGSGLPSGMGFPTDQVGAAPMELPGGSGSPSPLPGGAADTESSSTPSDIGQHSILPGSGTGPDSSGTGLPGGLPSPLPGGATDTGSSSTPLESANTGSASPAPPSPSPASGLPEPTEAPGKYDDM